MPKEETSHPDRGDGRLNHPSIESPRVGWAVLDNAPDGILICADDGRIVYASRAVEQIFGHPIPDLVGESVERLLPAANRLAHRAHRANYSEHPTRRPMSAISPLWGLHRDGRRIPVDVALSPVTDDNHGDERWVMAAVRDISDRQRLVAENELILRAIDATHDGVFVFDAATLQFTYANQGAEHQTGYTAAELTAGLTPLDIGNGFDEEDLRNTLAPLLNGTASRTLDITWTHRNGTESPIELTLEAPQLSTSGSQPVIIALARDITERREAERLERAAAAERERLERWSAVLNDRDRIARDLHDMVIQRLFAAGMSLQSTSTRSEAAAITDQLDTVVEELDGIIAEIRSSIFHLQQPLASPTLEERIGDVVARHQRGTGVDIRCELAPGTGVASADVIDGLAACAEEALSNAVRHAEAASIDVTVEVDGDHLMLTVRDDGVGIPDVYSPGNGIVNLSTRAAGLGGSCTIRRRDAANTAGSPGTEVIVTAPLPTSSRPASPD